MLQLEYRHTKEVELNRAGSFARSDPLYLSTRVEVVVCECTLNISSGKTARFVRLLRTISTSPLVAKRENKPQKALW